MNRFNNEVISNRDLYIENILMEDLKLKDNLSQEELVVFYESIIPYIQHSKNKDIAGRTPETIDNDLKKFINFSKMVGLNEREIIESISRFPAIMRAINEEFYWKYIFLSVIENEDNTLRKSMLVSRPRDFLIDLNLLFSRYCLMKKLKYDQISWNSLVKNSSKEFASIFIKGKYYKSYKIYDSEEDISSEVLRFMFPVDYKFLMKLSFEPQNNFIDIGEVVKNSEDRTK